MKLAYVLAAAAALAVGACDSGGGAPAAPAPAATPAPSPPPPPPPPPAEPVAVAGMTTPFATEVEWLAGCAAATPKIPESVCTCVSKAAIKEVGVKGLYTWIWEGYVNREGMAQMRSKKWFTDNGMDSATQQKFADAVGKCYTN